MRLSINLHLIQTQLKKNDRGVRIFRPLIVFMTAAALFTGSGCVHTVYGNDDEGGQDSISGLEWTASMPLAHAKEYRVDYYGDDYTLITIHDQFRYLLLEEGADVPKELPEDIQILQKPLEHIYASSSSCPDFFRELGVLDQVTMTSTKAEDWTIPAIRDIVLAEDMIYVGKYSAPDYEYICDEGCSLAIENTMIYHAPEVSEMLMRLQIPVLTEYSSYEDDPLGRLEWIMLYGVLTDREQEARTFFEDQVSQMNKVLEAEAADSRPDVNVVFFYIGANGSVNVRRENDYVSRMIEMAGGKYMLQELEAALPDSDSGTGSITVQMESFYSAAKDADVLIYNGTLGESLENLKDFLQKSPMLEQFKAVKTGRVYCSKENLFQEVTGTCRMVADFCKVIRAVDGESDEDLTYLRKLT